MFDASETLDAALGSTLFGKLNLSVLLSKGDIPPHRANYRIGSSSKSDHSELSSCLRGNISA